MKIAISGKGGVGKTTISGTLCRVLGRKGFNVLAIDGDPNPNLSVVLGLPPIPLTSGQTMRPLTPDLLNHEEDAEGKAHIGLGISVEEVIKDFGVQASDNVTLLMVGKPDHAGTGCMCSSHATVREVIHAVVSESNRVTVLDMEASLEHLKRGTAKYVDALYIVVEPYYRSLEMAQRIEPLAKELGLQRIFVVANKVKNADEEEAIRQFCRHNNLQLVAAIPFDEKVVEAEKFGRSPFDYDEKSRAVRKIREIAEHIRQL